MDEELFLKLFQICLRKSGAKTSPLPAVIFLVGDGKEVRRSRVEL